jgi:D12 class N6 adenine-specific DNA methyltransferase
MRVVFQSDLFLGHRWSRTYRRHHPGVVILQNRLPLQQKGTDSFHPRMLDHSAKGEVIFGDGTTFLQNHCLKMPPHSLVYIDPPYVTNGYKLYRYHFGKADHERLAEAVNDLRVPWLMSYDNHSLIRDLYIGEQAKFVKTYQSLRSSRFVKEILLLSDDFLPPSGERAETDRRYKGHAELMKYEH